jgi:hypothetical protein
MNKSIFKSISRLLVLVVAVCLLCGCTKHKTDEDVKRYLMDHYNEEFEIVSKEKGKDKGTEASCTKNVTINIWKAKSKSSGKEVEVREFYRMGSFTCEYGLISYD